MIRSPCSNFTLSILHFTLFLYVAVPEKYLMPLSVCSFHGMSESNVADAGASHPAGNATFHGPETMTFAGGRVVTVFVVPSLMAMSADIGCQARILPSRHSQSGGGGGAILLAGSLNESCSLNVTVVSLPSYT